MLTVQLTGFHGPNALELVEVPEPVPGPRQVVMRTTSMGLNRAELMATQGQYPMPGLPAVMGLEAGGVIESVGSEVTGWLTGMRVTPAHGAFIEKGRGSWAELVAVDAEDLVLAPANVPDHRIGGLWLPFITAWHALHHVGLLDDSMTVVIPAGSSSVGLAALQVCEHIGARTIATTRSAAKVRGICQHGFIHESDIIVTTRESLAAGLERILGKGELVDLFFDPIGGDFLEEELRCLKPGGTIVVYGGLGGRGQLLTGLITMKRARILGYHLGMLRHDLDLTNPDNTYRVLVNHFEQEVLVPTEAGSFPLSDAREALLTLERNEHVGKFYLTP